MTWMFHHLLLKNNYYGKIETHFVGLIPKPTGVPYMAETTHTHVNKKKTLEGWHPHWYHCLADGVAHAHDVLLTEAALKEVQYARSNDQST